MSKLTLIYDNAGTATLQTEDGYAHYYDDMTQMAQDCLAYLTTDSSSGWDGNDPDSSDLEPTHEQIRNGCYRVFRVDTLEDLSGFDSNWGNVRDFAAAIAAR